jgi:hypothetical protein
MRSCAEAVAESFVVLPRPNAQGARHGLFLSDSAQSIYPFQPFACVECRAATGPRAPAVSPILYEHGEGVV